MHLLRGYAAVRDGDEVLWRSELLENTLLNQGEQEVLNVFLREQAHKSKYLALLDMPSLADPAEDDTIVDLSANESKAPGAGGYARQQVLAGDWAAPVLVDDYRTSASAAKVFGPFTGTLALITHILLVTTATGTASPATLALAYVPLGTQISVAVGLTFSFTPTMTAF